MKIRFYPDPETGQPHIYCHGVTEEEVRQIMLGRGEEFAGDRSTRLKLGQTAVGRYLQVVYVTDPEPDSVFVITTYELRGKPLKAFRRRQRRKRR